MLLNAIKRKLYVTLFIVSITQVLHSNNTFFVTTIPKAGTHLLIKCLSLITNKPHKVISFYDLNPQELQKVMPHEFGVSHLYGTSDNIKILQEQGYQKCIFMIRDPRDTFISATHWVYAWPGVWPELQKLSFDQLLTYIISNKNAFYERYLEWRKVPFVYTTTFEKLVGDKGKGSKKAQLQEIISIAHYLNIPIKKQKALSIMDQLFGGTVTYREGRIGAWKKYFKEEHKKLCKELIGQLLIDLAYEKNLNW